ncbi:hypothetical protein RUM43_011301 [Polyplax serrata]|uniref:Uncharacterized protein n=1 Tax=Polyplax serrata TaxID=468196 RepID=A0AAN8PUF2_POLSC
MEIRRKREKERERDEEKAWRGDGERPEMKNKERDRERERRRYRDEYLLGFFFMKDEIKSQWKNVGWVPRNGCTVGLCEPTERTVRYLLHPWKTTPTTIDE